MKCFQSKYQRSLTNSILKLLLKIKTLYTKLKSSDPKELQSNLVYNIPCKDCHSLYIGETEQYLKSRIVHHKYTCRNNLDIAFLRKHAEDNHHNFWLQKNTILEWQKKLPKKGNYRVLTYKERKRGSTSNKIEISTFYNYLFKIKT